jgi:ribulose-phosphate 3-epimerase
MSHVPIVPAVIPRSEAEVRAMTTTLSFSKEFHLDLVDGVFVPSSSWPFEPAGNPLGVKPFTDKFTLEVDLMVARPYAAAKAWIEAGADMLVFHMETTDLGSFNDFVEHTPGVSVGISLHGNTPMEAFLPYVSCADYVQLMGIHTIGLQGQPFDEEVFEKIALVKVHYPNKMISIDGSVNSETIPKLIEAGVDRLIVGSAIVKQLDPYAAYQALQTLVNEI